MSTVPVFAPDGTLGDIPAEKLHDAIAAGAKPGVTMKSPDGTLGVVPADKYREAAQAGGKVVPFEQQDTQHPGFWHAVASYFDRPAAPFDPMHPKFPEGIKLPTAEENAQRKAAGYGPTYRALVPAAEAVGMNVKGTEQAAREGDTRGVLGYAAVPAAMAVAPLAVEAATPVVKKAGQSIAEAASSAANSPTARAIGTGVKQAASSAVRRVPYVGQVAGDVYDAIKNAKTAPVYRDATLDPVNIPEYAGETPSPASPEAMRQWWRSRGGGTVDGPIDRATMEKPIGNGGKGNFYRPHPGAVGGETAMDIKPVADVVDNAIPAENKALNLQVKSKVEFYLKKGDVASAEKALDTAAAKVNPDWPPERPPYAGDTNTIRANLPENVAKRRAELLDDQGIQQQMAQNLEQHGISAESEARREFIARNSTGKTKGDLIREAGGTVPDKPVKYTKTVPPRAKPAPPPQDLTALLEESVRQAKLRKQAGGR